MTGVLAYFFQHGGLNALSPLIPRLRQGGLLEVGSRPALEPALKRLGLDAACPSPASRREALGMFQDVLRHFKPDVVLTDTINLSRVSDGYLYAALIDSARNLSIPSISYVDCWWGYGCRFALPHQPSKMHLPDIIAVVDEMARQEMLAEGFSSEQVRVLGNPRFAEIAARKSAPLPDAMRQELRLNESSLLLAFVSQPLSILPNSMNPDVYDESVSLLAVMDELSNLPPDVLQRVRLVVLPHPEESGDTLHALIASHRLRDLVFVNEKAAPHDLLAVSDLVLGMSSILLVEAVLMERPVISIQLGSLGDTVLITNKIGATQAVTNRADLADQLARALQDADFRKRLVTRQGKFTWLPNASSAWLETLEDMARQGLSRFPFRAV